METGIVKWFNEAKGYGFIVDDEVGQDLFVHFSAIETSGEGFRSLAEGDKVSYTVDQSPKGLCAGNARKR